MEVEKGISKGSIEMNDEFWESNQEETQPLTKPPKAILEPEPPDKPNGGTGVSSPISLLILPLKTLWSAIWDSGISCMVVSAAIQPLAALFTKLTAGRVPVFEILVFRASLCWFLTIVLARAQGNFNVFGSRKYLLAYFIRGIFGALGMALFYFAVLLLPLADMLTLWYVHPAMILVLAWLVKGEMMRWPGVVGILASMIGTLVVSQPPFLMGGQQWSAKHLQGVFASLLSALFVAVAFTAIRFIPKSEPSNAVAGWFQFCGLLTSGIPLAIGVPAWPVVPNLPDSFCVLGVGVCSFASHIFIARSLQIEIAAKASAAGYLQVVIAYGYGLVFLGEGIHMWNVIGSLIICIGVVATSWPSKKVGGEILPVTVAEILDDSLPENELVPLAEPHIEADDKAKIMILSEELSEKLSLKAGSPTTED